MATGSKIRRGESAARFSTGIVRNEREGPRGAARMSPSFTSDTARVAHRDLIKMKSKNFSTQDGVENEVNLRRSNVYS